jgi:hypothetical protein
MEKKQIPLTQKSISNWNGRYPRAMETEDFVFFVNFQEGDENASVFMYRKEKDFLELVASNYFAFVGIMQEFQDGNEIWMSPAMKKERKIQIEELMIPLVKEYIELSHNCDLGERFNELEEEIEEYYVTLPEENVCAFLENKFAEYL